MGSTWITSDLHFDHRRICELAKRPFDNVEDMNESLIESWRRYVEPSDRIFVVGDFGFTKGPDLVKLWKALPGEKHLVIGNHDERNPQIMALPWYTKGHIVKIKERGMRLLACHYPMTTWAYPDTYVHVHGHSHGNLTDVRPRRADVGVDTAWPDRVGWGRPLHVEEVWGVLSAQQYDAVDHHSY